MLVQPVDSGDIHGNRQAAWGMPARYGERLCTGGSLCSGEEIVGKVYILTNSAMPGYVKVGKTDREVEERALEISSSTGVPVRFEVFRAFEFVDVDDAERKAHDMLSSRYGRVNDRREFFACTPAEAAAVIESINIALRGSSAQGRNMRAFDRYDRCEFTFAAIEFEEYLTEAARVLSRPAVKHIYVGYVASSLRAGRPFIVDTEIESFEDFIPELTKLLRQVDREIDERKAAALFAHARSRLGQVQRFFDFKDNQPAAFKRNQDGLSSIENANSKLSEYAPLSPGGARMLQKLAALRAKTRES